jgi:DNA-3-methyladenine glycosylase
LPHRLRRDFFERDALELAPDLLGCILATDDGVRVRITETEAYRPDDTACHAFRGETPRNAPMFGQAGRAYVYMTYGIHHMLNVVADRPGTPAAVLIRAAEPVEGLDAIRARRDGREGPALLDGPGKLTAALGIDRAHNTLDLLGDGPLRLEAGTRPERIATGPRIGIQYADPRDVTAPWRFADADSRWVSHRRKLTLP